MADAAWQGLGPCFSAAQYRGAALCPQPWATPSCPKHHSVRPHVAFVVAGVARGFLDHRGWLTYFQHMLKSFHGSPDSRVILDLKIARGPGLDWRWRQLGQAMDALRPAVVKTRLIPAEYDLASSIFRPGAGSSAVAPAHPECFWRDERIVVKNKVLQNELVLSRASIWYTVACAYISDSDAHSQRRAHGRVGSACSSQPSTRALTAWYGHRWGMMGRAWDLVESHERENDFEFDAVVFSRPDIFWQRDMGPWCAYDLRRVWYAPFGETTPDMFWIMPRGVAKQVLTTWTKIVLPCKPGELCCNLMTRPGEKAEGRAASVPNSGEVERVTVSNWIVTYWKRALGLRPNHTLRGSGQVQANPMRVIYGKARRNCTMHLGCVPPHKYLDVARGKETQTRQTHNAACTRELHPNAL